VIAGHEWMKGGVRLVLLPLVLAVQHPAEALLLILMLAVVAGWRLARRQRFVVEESL